MNEVVNGAAATGAEIAVLPNGTGQDFGRTHAIPTGFDDAVARRARRRDATVDIGASPRGRSTRYFANVGSAG